MMERHSSNGMDAMRVSVDWARTTEPLARTPMVPSMIASKEERIDRFS
jgi:hypothetical protein